MSTDPIRIPIRPERRGSTHVPAIDRMRVRSPGLMRRTVRLMSRLPRRSRLRRELLAWAMVQQYAAVDRRDYDAMLSIYDPEVVFDAELAFGELNPGVETSFRGHDGIRAFFHQWEETWESWNYEPLELVDVDGERFLSVIHVHVRANGSGIEVSDPLTDLIVLRDGLVAEQHSWRGDRGPAFEAAGIPMPDDLKHR